MRPIRRFQNPPNQGAFLGMNLQVTPSLLSAVLTSFEEYKAINSSAAALKVVALSDIISWGVDLCPVNRRNARRNVSVDRSATTSRCTALVVAQVNRHIYTLTSSSLMCTYSAPVKSTPVTEKGCDSCVLAFGSGAGSGVAYGLPECFLHMTHQWRRDFTYCLACGIQ